MTQEVIIKLKTTESCNHCTEVRISTDKVWYILTSLCSPYIFSCAFWIKLKGVISLFLIYFFLWFNCFVTHPMPRFHLLFSVKKEIISEILIMTADQVAKWLGQRTQYEKVWSLIPTVGHICGSVGLTSHFMLPLPARQWWIPGGMKNYALFV